MLALTQELLGFPRHLSQHVGGFVITRSRLDEVVPIENAAMEDRTVIEWDKDDLNDLGLLKVDVLGLGMLSCLRRGFDFLRAQYGVERDLFNIQDEDPAVYRMIQRADTIGVFQIESRAQMSMLPRLQAGKILRSRHRSGDRAAGPDPGQHGASLSAAAAGTREGRVSIAGARTWRTR